LAPDHGGVETAHDWLLNQVRRYAVSVNGTEKKYLRYPERWFGNEQYFDEIEQPEQRQYPTPAAPGRARAKPGKYRGIGGAT